MDDISLGQMLIYKSCLHDFDFPDGTCDNLLDGNHTTENSAVQNEVWMLLMDPVWTTHIFIHYNFRAGHWGFRFFSIVQELLLCQSH